MHMRPMLLWSCGMSKMPLGGRGGGGEQRLCACANHRAFNINHITFKVNHIAFKVNVQESSDMPADIVVTTPASTVL